jgi:hypothetical protein
VHRSAVSFAQEEPVYSLGSFVKIDHDLGKQLEMFVSSLQKEGVHVIIFLPPYHPETYKRLVSAERYKIILEAQSYFIRLAKEKRIILVGSYNSIDYGCDENDFYDGMHAKESCIRRIFNGLTGEV